MLGMVAPLAQPVHGQRLAVVVMMGVDEVSPILGLSDKSAVFTWFWDECSLRDGLHRYVFRPHLTRLVSLPVDKEVVCVPKA